MTAAVTTNPLASLLAEREVLYFAVVDDAFGPPVRKDFGVSLESFWTAVEDDDRALAELNRIAGSEETGPADLAGPAELTDAVLARLHAKRGDLGQLAAHYAKHLDPAVSGKLAPLTALVTNLDKELGRKVTPHTSLATFNDTRAQIIFVDYYMGPAGEAASVRTAKDIVSGITEKYGEGKLPLLVLMSASEITPTMVEEFRESTGWLGGMFYFVRKQDFFTRDVLHLHLATWSVGLPVRHTIQRFVAALDAAAQRAAAEFRRRVRALGVEDYTNIQWLSLQPEGHPLGDYMLWLYKSLFAYLLHQDEEVLKEQEQLDAITVKQFTPSQYPPSTNLAELYRFALTEPGVDEAGPHRRSKPDAGDFYLRLGDMFFKKQGREVLIVLSAACDLAYAPEGARAFPSERFVLFEYGELQPIVEEPKQAAMRTELFLHDGHVYRILWDHRRAAWKEYGQAQGWLAAEGYTRRARLALPYALELQKSFANHITRIGMPVKPPMLGRGDVEVYCEGEDGGWERLEAIADGAQVIRRKRPDGEADEELFVLIIDCIGRIVTCLQRVHERLTRQQATLTTELAALPPASDPQGKKMRPPVEGRLKGLDTKLTKLTTLMQTYSQWLPMVETPQPLPPSGGKHEIDPKLLWVYRNASFTGRYAAGPPIVLHVGTPVPRTEPPTGATDQAAITVREGARPE